MRIGKGHRWIDERYYCAGGILIDIEEETAVWKYNSENCITASPDGRFWYAAVGLRSRPYLCATEVPSREVRSILDRALVAGVVLKPGSTVSVQSKTEGSPSAEACERITRAVEETLTEQGFRVGAGAQVSVEITVCDEPYDRSSALGLPAEPGSRHSKCSVELNLVDSNGRSYGRNYSVDFVDDTASGKRREAEQSPWQTFEAWARSQNFPRKVFRWSAGGTAGTSELIYDGEKIKTEYSGR